MALEVVKQYVSAKIIVSVIVAVFVFMAIMWAFRKLGILKPKAASTAPQAGAAPKPTTTPKSATVQTVTATGLEPKSEQNISVVSEEEEEGTTAG